MRIEPIDPDASGFGPTVYSVSRVRTTLGAFKVSRIYAFKVLKMIVAYFVRPHPRLSLRQRVALMKPVRRILAETFAAWKKWGEFPYNYYFNNWWLRTSDDVTNVENLVPIVKHEIDRDRSVALRSKEMISSKIFMSRLMSVLGLPQAKPVIYAEYGRVWLPNNEPCTEQSLRGALQGLTAEKLFLKFEVSYGGIGVLCFVRSGDAYRSDAGDTLDFDYVTNLAAKANFVCQEGLRQVGALNALNEDSINTLRVMTRLSEHGADIVGVALRVGRKGTYVDNGTSGGLSCHVDADTWCTVGEAVQWLRLPLEYYAEHPDTGAPFGGIQLPFGDETKELVRTFAVMFPGCPVIGWDICLTDTGPAIVEVNWNPDVQLVEASSRSGRADIFYPV